jgi:hypothetical protein
MIAVAAAGPAEHAAVWQEYCQTGIICSSQQALLLDAVTAVADTAYRMARLQLQACLVDPHYLNSY